VVRPVDTDGAACSPHHRTKFAGAIETEQRRDGLHCPRVGPSNVEHMCDHSPRRPLAGRKQVPMDEITLECPDCGVTLNVTVTEIADQRTKRCARGHSVDLRDNGGGARKAQRALDDLEKTLRRLGR
jgi:hypothetical protein